MLLVIVLSIPAVQTQIAKRVTDNINATYGTDIQLRRLGLNWKGQVDMRGVLINDHHKDTLIFSEEIQTSLLSVKRLMNGDLDFGHLNLLNAKLHLTTYKDEVDDNLFVFTEKFNTGDTTSTRPFQLISNSVNLTNTEVRIIDENLETPEVFHLDEITMDASDFRINGPEITADINELALFETRGLRVNNLKAQFRYSETELTFNDLLLETEGSFLQGNVKFSFGEEGMSNFNDNVWITALLDDSVISTNDLNAFYDEFGDDISINIKGDIKGTLNNFNFDDARLAFNNTRLIGNYSFKNLLNDNTYFISGRNHAIATNYHDLKRLMPNLLGSQLPTELNYFGNFSISGNTQLDGDLLNTNSVMTTAIGSTKLKMELGNIHNFDNAFYRGDVQFMNFDLGKIAGTKSLGVINSNLAIDGRGFTRETVNTKIKGNIDSFNFEGYTYRKITVSGNLKDPIFNGELKINDPNLQMDFSGLVDISKASNQYDFEANIEFAELNKLNLIKRDSVSVFAGRIIMDMEGTTINDAVGNIEFLQSFYQTENDDFFFDDFLISSFFTEDVRTIEINSPDIINGKISGKFLIEDIPNLFHNSIGSIYTNYIPNEVTENQYIDYEFEIYNKIVDLFVPDLRLGENTRVKGSVYSDESKFKLDFKSPELLLLDNYLGKVNVQLDNDNPLFNAYVSVDSLYTGVYNLSEVNIINKTLNDTLYIQSNFKGGKTQEDLFKMSLYHTINPNGKSVVGIKRSKITYKDNEWFLNRNNNSLNKITFDNNFRDLRLDSLTLRHKNELIQMAGVVRDTLYTDIKLNFRDVDIGKLVPEIDSLNLEGNINGRLNFLKKKGAFYPNTKVVIDNVRLNEVPFGDLNLDISGNSDLTRYTIKSSLDNNSVKSFSANGNLTVTNNDSNLNLDVDLNEFNLEAFSPFGGDVITNIRGFVTGEAKVNGSYKSPDINGRLSLNDAGFTIPYLDVDYDLRDNSAVFITKEKFNIASTTITDTKYNTEGALFGNVTHQNFENWELDLDLNTGRMLVLDTPPDDEALYYGTAFISGESTIKGPVDELVIDVIATTEEGTTFKIPISDAASISDDSFIHFISPEEKKARISGETIVSEEVKGLSLNFELDITDKAEVEVVVDKTNDSRLKGRGVGTLLLEINTLGKFKMWGDFLVIEGKYDFRYGGLVDKTIDVLGGGSITWDGNPTRAILDLTAKYETTANPAVLLDNPTFNRAIPVEVLVDLSGEILQPALDFRIQFPNTSST
ncbi:MAG: translocation/assembly module TamB, partial [Flavobacteriaceae bacterium]|nr:translocation/assembly module TamB [Flavobacteriaceae bacterium]